MHFAAAWPMRSYRVLLYNGHSFLPCHICMAGKLCYTKVYLKTKAIPHNSKCRYGERGTAAAKPKAQIILDAAKVSAASGGCSEPKQGQRSQSARGFCPRCTMRVPQPDIIEHFGNADAVPQLPERYLSRKAGIVRCCLGKKVVQDLISGGLHCLWGRVNPLRRTPQLVAIFGRRNAV